MGKSYSNPTAVRCRGWLSRNLRPVERRSRECSNLLQFYYHDLAERGYTRPLSQDPSLLYRRDLGTRVGDEVVNHRLTSETVISNKLQDEQPCL